MDYEIKWPTHEEQLLLIGMNDTFESCLLIDCMDIEIQKHPADWYNYFKSWKKDCVFNLFVVDLKERYEQLQVFLLDIPMINCTSCINFRQGSWHQIQVHWEMVDLQGVRFSNGTSLYKETKEGSPMVDRL